MNDMRIRAIAFVAASGAPSVGLAEDWITNPANGYEYRLTEVVGDWAEAQAEAEQFGGHLATIRNDAENVWLLENFAQSVDRWIGLYQDADDPAYSEPAGGWKWASGEDASYRCWGSGQPGEDEVGENWSTIKCSTCYNAGRWHDQGSGAGNAFRGIIEQQCPADLDGNGVVDSIDFLIFLNLFVVGDPAADWNDDGSIDSLDFLAFMNQWVLGCP